MKSYKNLYPKIYDLKNLISAWRKARKGKTKRDYVIKFEEDLAYNLKILYDELKNQIYSPKPLKTFILRDPKTRKISKADFRDRIIHHAIHNVLEPIFDKTFIYDNCAGRKEKGTLFAIKRLDFFVRKVSRNGKINGWFNNNQIKGYCFKADIKHYFQEINHNVLLEILQRKIKCEKTLWLIKQILIAPREERERRARSINNKGMPLGNLTSQFFANIYLNELDQFVKHKLKARYYIRYVDDFIILNSSKTQLKNWKNEIQKFLKEKLKLELHPDKSKIINLSKGIDFVGFRNFYYFKLLRKRSIRKMKKKINLFKDQQITKERFGKIFQGWNSHSDWTDNYWLKNKLIKKLNPNYSISPPSSSTSPSISSSG